MVQLLAQKPLFAGGHSAEPGGSSQRLNSVAGGSPLHMDGGMRGCVIGVGGCHEYPPGQGSGSVFLPLGPLSQWGSDPGTAAS